MNKTSRIDFNSVVGILLAFIAILVGQVLEGGHIDSLMQVAAFIIVVGGTVGAVLLQSPINVFINGLRMSIWVIFPPSVSTQSVITQVVDWSNIARKDGLLALDAYIHTIQDPLAKKGLQLLVDGSEPEKLREVLEVESYTLEAFQRQSAKIWDAAGGYAPTIGILGAVLGLIHVMENLADPEKLGSGIAVAFVATIYGVALANLIFLPIANKLKSIIEVHAVIREMLIDGIVAIADGENPRLIESRLKGYVI
jgi:chemotaxis protein MotA